MKSGRMPLRLLNQKYKKTSQICQIMLALERALSIYWEVDASDQTPDI